MKRLAVTTIGICAIALTILAFDIPKDITIVLKQGDITKYEKHQANIDSAISNSNLTGKEIIYIRSQMAASTQVLLKNIKPIDTAKK